MEETELTPLMTGQLSKEILNAIIKYRPERRGLGKNLLSLLSG
jgi:hypothetical protein